MVKFGTTTLPLVLEVEELQKKVFLEKMIPGASIAKRLVRGSYGGDYLIRGLIEGSQQTVIDQIAALKALADGTARALDFCDGSSAVTCLMLDPHFRQSGKPKQALWDVRFVQTA
jgi:hypothetical protein